MNWEHPELQEMLCLGCSNPMKVMLAFQSYMHLCEVEKLHNVKYFYNSELDLICLSSSDNKKLVFHIPIPAQFRVSPAWLHDVNTVLLKENPLAEVNILLRTQDTTLLPYKLTEGLCPPPTPESTKEKKAMQEKLQCVQSELHKRKQEFYEEAKRKRIESSEVHINKSCDDKNTHVNEKFNDEMEINESSDDKKEYVSEVLDKKLVSVNGTLNNGMTIVNESCEDKKASINETFNDEIVIVNESCNDNRGCVSEILGKKMTSVEETLKYTMPSGSKACDSMRSNNSEKLVEKKYNTEEPCNDNSENISEMCFENKTPTIKTSIDKKDLDMDCEV